MHHALPPPVGACKYALRHTLLWDLGCLHLWATHCVQFLAGTVFGVITAIAGPLAAILTRLAVIYSYRMIKLRVVSEVRKYLKVEDISETDAPDSGHAPAVSHSVRCHTDDAVCFRYPCVQQHVHICSCAAAAASKSLYRKIGFALLEVVHQAR